MALWRKIAQDRRGARHRPLDSRIKRPRCAAVDRVTVQRLIATFSGMAAPCKNWGPPLRSTCQHNVLTARPDLVSRAVGSSKAPPGQPTPVKARAARARLRWLAALTSAGRPGVCRPCADGSAAESAGWEAPLIDGHAREQDSVFRHELGEVARRGR